MLPCGQLDMECCGKAAAFVLRRRMALMDITAAFGSA